MPRHPPWSPTASDLDAWARTHLEYETRMLLHQVRFLFEIFPITPTSALGDALIEAPIVHLRLFDNFFGQSAARDDDVIAKHWNSSWSPQRILSDVERDEAVQHVHLVARRGSAASWQPRLPGLAAKFCDVFETFIHSLVLLDPQRAAAFDHEVFWIAEFRSWKQHRGL